MTTPNVEHNPAGFTPGRRLYAACFDAFGYSRPWEAGQPETRRQYERAAKAFLASDPATNATPDLLEALRWCVENDGECLGDHPARLAKYRAALSKAQVTL